MRAGAFSGVCPKCQASMQIATFAEIAVERCTSCGGIWFQWRTNQQLKEKRGAHAIDTGDVQVGRMLNVVEQAYCPDCKVQMIPMVDQEQPHIWYESCPRCHGIYMDAGEFHDYQEHSLVDFFRAIIAKDRS